MVPDSEWRMPTLMVSAAWMDQDRPMEAMDADSVKALSRLRRFIGVVLHSPAVGAAVFRRRRACRRASVRWTAGCALRPGSLRRGSRAKAVPLLGAGRYRSAKRRRESPGNHAEQAWLCRGRRRFQRVFAGYRRRRRRGHWKGMRRADLLLAAGGASMGTPSLRPGTTAVRQGAASRASASGWCAQPGNSEPFRPVTMICAASAQTNRPIRRLTICSPWSPSRRSMRSER